MLFSLSSTCPNSTHFFLFWVLTLIIYSTVLYNLFTVYVVYLFLLFYFQPFVSFYFLYLKNSTEAVFFFNIVWQFLCFIWGILSFTCIYWYIWVLIYCWWEDDLFLWLFLRFSLSYWFSAVWLWCVVVLIFFYLSILRFIRVLEFVISLMALENCQPFSCKNIVSAPFSLLFSWIPVKQMLYFFTLSPFLLFYVLYLLSDVFWIIFSELFSKGILCLCGQ